MFAVAVVAAAVEDDGGDAGPGDEVEDVIVAGGAIQDDTKGSGYYLVV